MLRPLPGRCPTGCGAGAPSGGWYGTSGAARVARTGDAAAAVSRTSRRHTGTAAMACSIKSRRLIASAQLQMTPVVTPQAWRGRTHAHRDGRCSPSPLIQLIIQNQSLWWFFTRAPYCCFCRNNAPCIWKTFSFILFNYVGYYDFIRWLNNCFGTVKSMFWGTDRGSYMVWNYTAAWFNWQLIKWSQVACWPISYWFCINMSCMRWIVLCCNVQDTFGPCFINCKKKKERLYSSLNMSFSDYTDVLFIDD